MRIGQNLLNYFNVTLPRKLNGKSVYLPVIGGVKVGISGEPFLLDLFGFFLEKTDGAVVDVGANIGQTLIKIKAVKPGQRYYGFEPNPACFTYLESLTRANEWEKVTFFPCAISNKTSIETLHISSKKPTDSQGLLDPSLNPTLKPDNTRKIMVLDFNEIDPHIEEPIGLLKIDVEGAELSVVRGMVDVIKRDKPLVFIELWPFDTLAERRTEVIKLIQSCGYKLFVVETRDNKQLSGFKAIDENHKPTQEMTDYVAIPDERLTLVDELRTTLGFK